MSVKELAQGKWRGILLHFGIDAKYLRNTHQRCPICRQGEDRYRFSDYRGNGDFYCNVCGHGSGIDLLMALKGWSFKEAAEQVERALGKFVYHKTGNVIDKHFSLSNVDDKERRRALNNVWLASRPVRENDETHRYLKGRGLTVLPPTLRTHLGLKVEGRVYPAMLAMVVNLEGEAVTIHHTSISRGQKAPLNFPKRTMSPKGGDGATNGCAIRLYDTGSDVLHLAEGIETSLAVREMTTDGDVWATKDAHLMEVLQVPKNYMRIELWPDSDKNFTGQAAAFALAKRLSHHERKEVHVHLPPDGMDWLQVLNSYSVRERVT